MATKRGQKSGLGTAAAGATAASNGKAPAPSPANAWARPLKTTGPPPGMGPADKSRAPTTSKNNNNKTPNGGGSDGVSNIHRERLLHLSLTLIGQKVVATLTDGTVLEGVFHTFTPFDGLEADMKNKYVLNAVKVIKPGTDSSKMSNGSTVILAVDKVTQLYAKNINLDRPNNGAGAGGKGSNSSDFVTDTQISGARGGGTRELVAAGSAWTSATAPTPSGTGGAAAGAKPQSRAEALAGALGTVGKGPDTASGLKGTIGGWDQFKANQELFNVNASFDENLYTTELDKSQIDARKIAEAERIAREIENTASTNIHIAEERGQAIETDYDEEDRYSGVLTKEGKQRHEAMMQQDKDKVAAVAAGGAPKKIMNYAAAAAKADPAKKAGPPGFAAGAQPKPSTGTPEAAKPAEDTAKAAAPDEKKEAPAPAPKDASAEVSKKADKPADAPKEDTPSTKVEGEKKEEVKADEKKEVKEVAKTSKLNANAKEFTFNPAAKSFTPSFGGGASFVPPQQHQPQHIDPNMQMHGGPPMQPPHYMHAQMGQPGMMPMMAPQYPGMRYPQFPGMDQHGIPQMQPHQLQHVQVAAGTPPPGQQPPATGTPAPASQGAPAPPTGEGDSTGAPSQDGESSQQGPQSQQPQQPHQQPMPMPYNMPQGAYFPGGAMPMRGPGGYPPQFVGGPQQIPVGPQGTPYGRQMYPMQPGGMPPNMHMRGPGGAPFYAGPTGPMPYPPGAYGHGMMDDGDGFRGRGRGQGRGRGRGRGGGGGGRAGPGGRGGGRGHYPHQQPPPQYGGHGSGASTPHGGSDQGANSPTLPQEGEMPQEGGGPEVASS